MGGAIFGSGDTKGHDSKWPVWYVRTEGHMWLKFRQFSAEDLVLVEKEPVSALGGKGAPS